MRSVLLYVKFYASMVDGYGIIDDTFMSLRNHHQTAAPIYCVDEYTYVYIKK